ncbi:MAG: hypothetical protein AAB353_09670, partial [Candidatus Hydrogenedentota bacterium]
KRVVLPTKSYAASAIVSVKVQGKREKQLRWYSPRRISPWFAIGAVIIAGGAGAAYVGVTGANGTGVVALMFGAMGVLCVVLGFALIVLGLMLPRGPQAPESYAVAISTVDGQRDRIAGLSIEAARGIADAISLATTRGK